MSRIQIEIYPRIVKDHHSGELRWLFAPYSRPIVTARMFEELEEAQELEEAKKKEKEELKEEKMEGELMRLREQVAALQTTVLKLAVRDAHEKPITLSTLRPLFTHENINTPMKDCGATFLHMSCARFENDLVKWAIEMGADVKLKTREGNTPLMFLTRAMHYQDDKKQMRRLYDLILNTLLCAGASLGEEIEMKRIIDEEEKARQRFIEEKTFFGMISKKGIF